MSRVLKKNGTTNAPAVHSLVSAWDVARNGAVDAATAPPVDPERLALEVEQASLKHRLEQQAAELSDLRAQVRSAFENGEARGREAGRREAVEQDDQRLARLETGIDQAVAAFQASLGALERLAPALAREGLGRILGPSSERVPLVTAIVGHRLKTIEAQSIIHVEVSAADFADDLALEALEGTLGTLGPRVHASVSLKSGECRIKLKLGTLDVSLDQQWGRLGALLQDMAEPAGEEA